MSRMGRTPNDARRTGPGARSLRGTLFKGLKVLARAAGDVTKAGASFVKAHEKDIAQAGQAATDLAGTTIGLAGTGLQKGAEALADRLTDATKGAGLGVKAAAGTVKAVVRTAGVGGKGAQYIGDHVRGAAPAAGGVFGGVITGVVDTASGAVDAVAITDTDIRELESQLKQWGQGASNRSLALQAKIQRLQHGHRRKDLLDLLTIGGLSLASASSSPASVPADIERAFSLAYPGLAASGQDFGDAVARMSADELPGLVNGVKGKLFELQLVEQLNNGGLPDGLTASLATSATQAGHDIVVRNEAGAVMDVLSAKATDSASYVKDALERYPDIQVTTTSEVHAQLLGIGMADGVVDSGITDAALQSAVEAAAHGDEGPLQALMPSAVGLAVIALSSFLDKSISLEARGAEFGHRSAKAGVASVAAKGAAAASGFWWLGLAAGLGSGWLSNVGQHKRHRYDALKACVRVVEDLEQKRRSSPSLIPRAT